MDNLLTVHFHSMHGDYSDMKYVEVARWLWGEKRPFLREDDFGLDGRVTSPSIVLLILSIFWSKRKTGRGKYMIIVSGSASWEMTPNAIWVVEGDPTVYYSKQAALTNHSFSRDQHAFDMALRRQEFDQVGFSRLVRA